MTATFTSHALNPVPGRTILSTAGARPFFSPIQGVANAHPGKVGCVGVACNTLKHATDGAANIGQYTALEWCFFERCVFLNTPLAKAEGMLGSTALATQELPEGPDRPI